MRRKDLVFALAMVGAVALFATTAPPPAPTARPVRQSWLIARPSRATRTARTGAAPPARAAAATQPAPDPDALRAPAPLRLSRRRPRAAAPASRRARSSAGAARLG